MPLVTSSMENSNLHKLALAQMKDFSTSCCNIQTCKVSINKVKNKIRPSQVKLVCCNYTTNSSWETFLTYEDPKQDILISLLQLRKCSTTHTFHPEFTGQQTSIMHKLHVYSSAVPVHGCDSRKFQHCGFGTLLMEEAEHIAREEHGSCKISIISGVGVRSYYARLGYFLDGPYMSKMLDPIEDEE